MGRRVSPEEIEEAIRLSGLVEEVAVFGVPHELMGQMVSAVVVPQAAVKNIKKSLLEYCDTHLTTFMTPRNTIVRDMLPRTPNGKVDYESIKMAEFCEEAGN
ncbi:MAG: hypothetical protein P8N76_20700 [Pirellulaceae bacterium]|nr:hypothetical protein [Pirellulaceae bacterium]